jgi:FkbM family methyltransferase
MNLDRLIKSNRYAYICILQIVRLYDFFINSSTGRLYCALFNLKSCLRGWLIRFEFNSRLGLYMAQEGDKQIYFKHTKIANGSYTRGFAYRAEEIGAAYMLGNIDFADDDLIVDCGANVGDLHLYFERKHLKIRLVAFEPSKDEFLCLSKNICNIEGVVHNLGLWSSNGYLKFYVSSAGADSSLIEPLQYDDVIEVPTRRLDSLQISLPIKLLKIEAEGCEPEVLQGCAGILDSVQYISADLGFERGVDKESTLVPVCNYLYGKGFVMLDINFDRLCVLFRNVNLHLQ